jgi:hypothetical protein
MYFGTKSYLKSNRNHTAKHAHSGQPGHQLFVIGSNQDEMSGMTCFYTFHHHFNSLFKEIFHEKLDSI